jgi:predicted DNA-binding transcriptional regulator YafY
MSQTERFHKIDQMLIGRRSVTFEELRDRLQVSRATLNRDLAHMRDRLSYPIVFDRSIGGYRLDKSSEAAGLPYRLPVAWFSADEIYALLTMHYLLSGLDVGGLLGAHLQPVQARLSTLLGAADNSVEEIRKRVKIKMVGVRHFQLEHFEAIGSALLKRRRIRMTYHGRSDDKTTEREISPQRLICYQGNWYLDAWCHLKNGLRSFAVDKVQRLEILESRAREIPQKELDEILGAGYGIFAGRKVKWATLVFSAEAARWVATEQWHSEQQWRLLDDGRYELKVPYSHATELMMDIL